MTAENTSNAARFYALYRVELAKSIVRNPGQYGLREDWTPEKYGDYTADKMVTSIVEGGDVNVSDAMRRVAKKLGLPNTRRETIFAFIRS